MEENEPFKLKWLIQQGAVAFAPHLTGIDTFA